MEDKIAIIQVYACDIDKFKRYMFLSGLKHFQTAFYVGFPGQKDVYQFDVYYNQKNRNNMEKIEYLCEHYYLQYFIGHDGIEKVKHTAHFMDSRFKQT